MWVALGYRPTVNYTPINLKYNTKIENVRLDTQQNLWSDDFVVFWGLEMCLYHFEIWRVLLYVRSMLCLCSPYFPLINDLLVFSGHGEKPVHVRRPHRQTELRITTVKVWRHHVHVTITSSRTRHYDVLSTRHYYVTTNTSPWRHVYASLWRHHVHVTMTSSRTRHYDVITYTSLWRHHVHVTMTSSRTRHYDVIK